ncbi:MAG: hypothetical protein HYV05_09950 [Deltaproteobacteria bacterium]|nr:hypothetical protein [Deltaproteobacteria bacterium]
MGWKATFEIDGASFGLSQKVTSHLYLFSYLGEKWTVKYRFTYPKDFDGAKDIEMFLKTLEWTFGRSTGRARSGAPVNFASSP